MRRLGVIVALSAVAVAVSAGGAHAALWLLFSRTSAEPGDAVVVRTAGGGSPVFLAAKRRGELRRRPLRVFMVPAAEADAIRSPRDRRLSPVGRLSIDRRGRGRLVFLTPNLPPGEYRTLIHCVLCARYSNGRTLLPGGPTRPFRVRPGLRSCKTSVYGKLDPGWEARSVRAGPLWLVGIRTYPPRLFEPAPGFRYRAVKVLLMVENGFNVTLKIPQEMHGTVGLEYDRDSPFRRQRPSKGIRDAGYAVTFEGCAPNEGYEGPHTQFNGAFVVAGPICARLELAIAGREEPMSFAAPLGRPC